MPTPALSLAGAMSWFAPILEVSERAEGGSWFKTDYARTALDRVLAAKDRSTLADRLEEIIVDDEYFEQERRAAPPPEKLTPQENLAKLDRLALDMPSFAAVLGKSATLRFNRGFEDFKVMIRRMFQLAEKLQQLVTMLTGQQPATKEVTTTSMKPSDMYYDSRTPLVVRKELARLFRALMAWCAILRAQERRKKLDPRIALALAETFATETARLKENATMEAFAKAFVAVIHGATEGRLLAAAVDHWRRAADELGEGVLFPFDRAEHGEAR